MTSFYLVKK